MTRIPIFMIVLCVVLAGCLTAAAQSPSPTPVVNAELKRWLDIDTLSVATRYRYIEANDGQTQSAQQYQINARARFKFDPKGKYSVVAVVGTGNGITSGWNATGWGTGDAQGDINIKQLYFEAKPIKPLAIQFGGIAPYNGENTEITGYDNDSYIMGERVRVLDAKRFYFNEISLTSAFIGDPTRPNVFRRFKRLDEWNYYQFLVRKTIGKRAGFSADYTYDSGTDTLRQAIKVNVPEAKFVDSFRFENYQRLDPDPGYGFGLTGEKQVTPRLSLTGGVTRINHDLLNGDRFPRGTRLYLIADYQVTREFGISPVIIQAVGPLAEPSIPRTRFELIATYDVLEALRRFRVF